MLPQITEPVDLCLPSGALNPAAVGWSKQGLHRSNLNPARRGSGPATWRRTKRIEQWGIVTSTHLITATVNTANYAAAYQIWVLDRSDGTVLEQSAVMPVDRDVELPEIYGGGPVRARGQNLSILAEPEGETTHLRARTARVRLDARVDTSTEALGVVIPWSDRKFQYALRASAMPVIGELVVDDQHFALDSQAWASVHHGRGRWPYSTSYTSAIASGSVDGVRIGMHLGGLWTEGTGSTENALIVNSRLHYLPEKVRWTFEPESPDALWLIQGERVDVHLEPLHHGTDTTYLGVLATASTTVCGTWRGHVVDDQGTTHRVDGLAGWTEFTTYRW